MSNAKIEEELRQMVSEITEVPVEKLNPEADLFTDLGVDSLRAIEIVAAFEKRYKITVPEKDIPNIRTLKQIIEYFKEAKKE
ncbi:MAG: acyl carrier protein [Candidatus Omnitrophica bacterium]|nr:acyl carrier protein [Candidatus Omnitrophota bacterium]